MYINQSQNATTGLSNGSYTYQTFATNSSGSLNSTEQRTISIGSVDTIYPIFSNYFDNNATLSGSGTALFNITVTNTNGTVWLSINNTNYTTTNLTSNVYNVSLTLTTGIYNYTWNAYGNGTKNNLNYSSTISYVINPAQVQQPTVTTSNTGGGCLTNWTCSFWSSCINGIQIRNCTPKISYCYAYPNQKPIENQSCLITESSNPKNGSRVNSEENKTSVIEVNKKSGTLNNETLFFGNSLLIILFLIIVIIIAVMFINHFRKSFKK